MCRKSLKTKLIIICVSLRFLQVRSCWFRLGAGIWERKVTFCNRGTLAEFWFFGFFECESLGSLSSKVFERQMLTGSCLFALLSRDFEQFFGQIVSIRVKTLSNTNLVAARYIESEKRSLPVDVRGFKTSLLKHAIVMD